MALLLWLWSLGAKVDFEDPCQESQAFRQPMKAHTFVGLRLGPLAPSRHLRPWLAFRDQVGACPSLANKRA